MTQEDYVSFEVAKLLKEKGFDEPCYMSYWLRTKDSIEFIRLEQSGNNYSDCLYAPTHQMAMKWLREVHHICITIYPDKTKGYEAVLHDTKDDVEIILQSLGVYGCRIFRDSYEEAVEAALKYCLENLI